MLRVGRSSLEIVRRRLAGASPAARLEQGQLRLDDLANRLVAAGRQMLGREREALGTLAIRLGRLSPEPQLAEARERVRSLSRRLQRETTVVLDAKRKAVARCRERLASVGPDAVLRRGYVIVRDHAGNPVVSSQAVHPGARLSGQWHDGVADLEGV
jgi:exodeoxyribonuclease VII large subunit